MIIHSRRASMVVLLGGLWAFTSPRSVAANGGEGTASDVPSAEPRRKGLPFGLGIGLSVERRMASDPSSSDVWGVAPLPRFIARGLGPAFSFSRIDAGAVNARAEGSTELGVVRIKPVMAGLVWQQPLGKRTSAEMHVVAGYAFNSAGKPGRKPLAAQVAVPQAVVDVDDSFAWETRLALWRDLGPRLGVMVGARYLHTRPRFTFADGSARAWRADRVTLEAGLAFTLIKAPWDR